MLKEYHVVKAVVVSYRQARHVPLQCFQCWLVPGLACAESTIKTGEEIHMNAAKITGIILIVIGLAGFFTGGFSFTKNTTAAKIGPIELKVQEKESVNIPQWLSLGALALGAVVLVAGFRKP
jgi:hypothetical protein